MLTLLLESLAQTRILLFPTDDESTCFIGVHEVDGGISFGIVFADFFFFLFLANK